MIFRNIENQVKNLPAFRTYTLMRITKSNGAFVAVDIVGYQYPHHKHDYWDSNWLMIQIQANNLKRTWSAVDPCLTTMDVDILINWLKQVSSETQAQDYAAFVAFTEHYLKFRLVTDRKGRKKLRVDCHHTPKAERETGEKDIYIEFPLEEIPFSEIIEDLQNQLARFPQRILRDETRISIAGVSEGDVDTVFTRMKENLVRRKWIFLKKSVWDFDRGCITTRVIYEYPRRVPKKTAEDTLLQVITEALNFVPGVSVAVLQ